MSEQFITSHIHPSWTHIVAKSLACMDQSYLQHLSDHPDWLPGTAKLLNAFSLPLDKTRYILFGESPYPRAQSANGYAFWDAAVTEIWSEQGFSKAVNRATSLRNFIKMLLVADKALPLNDTSQPAISKIDKSRYISKLDNLFNQLQESGVLLLNATPVLRPGLVKEDGKQWLAFNECLLEQLQDKKITLLLFGKIAQVIQKLPAADSFKQLQAEHPYNLSFIGNPAILDFFRPLHLLRKA